MLKALTCPNCGGTGLQAQADGRVVCQYCGTPYAAPKTLCPECGHVNAEGAAFCSACGERLTRECRACGYDNWSGAEYCASCGRALDILEVVFQRSTTGMRQRLEEERAVAPFIKEEEERASQKRLEELWAIERERQQKLAEAAARQAARDKTTLQFILVGVTGVILALVIAIVVIAASR